MEFCGVEKFEDLIGQQNQIITYLMSLREKKLSYNSISTRLNAIYHFYDRNDISLKQEKEKERMDIEKEFTDTDLKELVMKNKKILIFKGM